MTGGNHSCKVQDEPCSFAAAHKVRLLELPDLIYVLLLHSCLDDVNCLVTAFVHVLEDILDAFDGHAKLDVDMAIHLP